MKVTRIREILVERERSLTIRFGSSAAHQFCNQCQSNSRFLTIDETAIIWGLSSRQVFRLAEEGKLHSIETNQGLMLICFASLPQTFKTSDQS